MKTLNFATEPFLFLYCITLGVSLTMVPQLIVSKICHDTYNDTICGKLSSGNYKHQEKIVYEKAAFWNTMNFCSVYLPSAVNILFIGALSDIISKRKLLMLVPIATTLQSVIFIMSANYMSTSLWLLVFGNSLTSVFADVQGAIMLAYSYIADVTTADQNRTIRMNILEGMIFLSLGISNYISGILLKEYGFVIAFLLSTSASVCNFIFIAFILPDRVSKESKNASNSTEFVSKLLSCIKMACISIQEFANKYIFSWEQRTVWVMLLAAFFTNSAILGENVILVVFLKHRPLALSPDQIGMFLLILQFTRGFGVIIFAFISLKLIKPSELCLITIGQISIISIFVGIGLSSKLQTLFGVTPLAIGFPLALSGLRSTLTKLVLPEEHGAVLSFVAFVSLIGITIMTFAANEVFRLTATGFTGLTILVLATVCLIGFLLTLVAFYCKNSKAKKIPPEKELEKEENFALLGEMRSDEKQDN